MFDFDAEGTLTGLRHARATTGREYAVLLVEDGDSQLELSAWEALPPDVQVGTRIALRGIIRSRYSGGRYWTDAVAQGVHVATPLPQAAPKPRQPALFAEDEDEKPAPAATPAPQPCTAGAASATGTAGASGETFAEYRARRMREAFGSRENQWRKADA